jgi:D-arabinose 1-dehydrogenase-like Zn-dependent alcohol dehydrogenase
MRAQVLRAFNEPYEFTNDHPKPEQIPPGDVLVKVLAASYCHTDTVYAQGVMAPATLPRVGCHEFAGEIAGIGDGIPSSLRDRLAIGTLVGVPVRSYHPCGECTECIHTKDDIPKYSVFCQKAGRLGVSIDGGFQDYVCVDARQLEPVPSPLTPIEVAPLMCAGLTIFASIQRAKHECSVGGSKCSSVAIIGAGGGLGHLGVQMAIKMGFAKVIATDTSDGALTTIANVTSAYSREELSRLVTVDARMTSTDKITADHLSGSDGSQTDDPGADAAIILPESQKAFDYGMRLIRRHGVCVVVSFPQAGFVVNPNDLVFRDISVVGSLIGSHAQLREMMHFAATHRIRAQTRTFALENLNELVEEYHRGNGGKLVVDMALKP